MYIQWDLMGHLCYFNDIWMGFNIRLTGIYDIWWLPSWGGPARLRPPSPPPSTIEPEFSVRGTVQVPEHWIPSIFVYVGWLWINSTKHQLRCHNVAPKLLRFADHCQKAGLFQPLKNPGCVGCTLTEESPSLKQTIELGHGFQSYVEFPPRGSKLGTLTLQENSCWKRMGSMSPSHLAWTQQLIRITILEKNKSNF